MSRANTATLLALLLSSPVFGCDTAAKDHREEAPTAEPSKSSEEKDFTFDIEATNGMRWTHEHPKARVRKTKGDYINLGGTDFSLRVMAYDLPDAGPAESTELGYNNTFLHFRAQIGDRHTMIGCHPERKSPKGIFVRSKLDDDTIEGRFEFELVRCNDYMTGKPIAYDGVPFTAKGSFSLPLSK